MVRAVRVFWRRKDGCEAESRGVVGVQEKAKIQICGGCSGVEKVIEQIFYPKILCYKYAINGLQCLR